MPLYAGVCETNITPPIGVWMSGYAPRPSGAVGVQDELYARALVMDNGHQRVALLSIDLIALDPDIVTRVREGIAAQIGTEPQAVMLHCTHTHGGPCTKSFRGMGTRDDAYISVMERKLIGVAKQAADDLRAAHLTYGESSAQIGVNRRKPGPGGRIDPGVDYGGPVAPLVQVVCVNGADGRTFALLFSHACHPTTLGGDNLRITAEWPGAAVAHLKARFRQETKESGIAPDALPFFLQGCCGDINPHPRGSWSQMEAHGRTIADAAHTARWAAHSRLNAYLDAVEETIELPLLPPPPLEECDRLIAEYQTLLEHDRATHANAGLVLLHEGWLQWAQDARAFAAQPDFHEMQPFAVQRLTFGGLHLLGFPAEMFVLYQLDFAAQSPAPVLSLGYTNGCWNYAPTAAEYARGGYEVEHAHRYYGTLMFAPECEPLLRDLAYRLLDIADPDTTPYPARG